MKVSVIICAYNPRPEYLERVLVALRVQSLPSAEWELILVDNASSAPLADIVDLSWHPNGRHVREDQPGLTAARLRGIDEASASLLVFVDDDNVLADDYLVRALEIADSCSFLGAWGGRIVGEYEVAPPAWSAPYLGLLAIRDLTEARWSNVESDWESQPYGAGLCVRSTVADAYRSELKSDVLRRGLDRSGASLLSGGDTDLVLTSVRFGQGWGVFPQLALTHLIPAGRLTERYLLALSEGRAASAAIMNFRMGGENDRTDLWRKKLRWLRVLIRGGPRDARFYWATVQGLLNGQDIARRSAE